MTVLKDFARGIEDRAAYHGQKLRRLIEHRFIRPVAHDVTVTSATRMPTHAELIVAAKTHAETTFGWEMIGASLRYGAEDPSGICHGGSYFLADVMSTTPSGVIECGRTRAMKIEFALKHGIAVIWMPYPHLRTAKHGVVTAHSFAPLDNVCWAITATGGACGESARLRVRNRSKLVRDRFVLCDGHAAVYERGDDPEWSTEPRREPRVAGHNHVRSLSCPRCRRLTYCVDCAKCIACRFMAPAILQSGYCSECTSVGAHDRWCPVTLRAATANRVGV